MKYEYLKLDKKVHQDLNSDMLMIEDRSENKNQRSSHSKYKKRYPEMDEWPYCNRKGH